MHGNLNKTFALSDRTSCVSFSWSGTAAMGTMPMDMNG
jgi:hypothetical protein